MSRFLRKSLGIPLQQARTITQIVPSALSSSFPYTYNDKNEQQQKQHGIIQRRDYHATPKREIIPLLVVGLGVGLIGRYSYRAMKRMDEEWEDYQWQLQHYEKQHRSEFIKKASKFPHGTLAVDVGTSTIKLAHNGNGILVSREGARTTFAGVVYTGENKDEDVLTGQSAMEKYWQVKAELAEMARPIPPPPSSFSSSSSKVMLQVLTPTIHDALQRATLEQSKMRNVVTVPPTTAVYNEADPRNPWKSVQDNTHNDNNTVWKNAEWIPEPVAAVWGAQVHGELPLHDLHKKPVLVVDVGGQVSTLSVVQKDVVLASVTLDFGGQAFVDAICDHVIATGTEKDKKAFCNLRNDGMAWQQLVKAAHAAVQELNTQTYTNLNIPYIGMDLETRQPIHLDMTIGRSLLEQHVTERIVNDMILQHEGKAGDVILSPHVPVITGNLSSLWMSLMTQLLTECQSQPQDLGHVLVVGGGAKHPFMVKSIQECFSFFQTSVVVPELATRSELVVLGASSILPQYEYDFEAGLIRLEGEVNDGEQEKQES